jgi:protein-S-isoprenylcysteine O-methyltransferase Ste14
MPVAIAGIGFAFNALNGYLNGRYVFTLSGGYSDSWLTDARFIFGVALFVCGYFINRQADRTLKRLRSPGDDRYSIPYGGMYRWISSPNYFGEIIEWIGWALATWSLPGLAFAVWCVANLVPRARAHHQWYQERFPDYPAERRALLPGVW